MMNKTSIKTLAAVLMVVIFLFDVGLDSAEAGPIIDLTDDAYLQIDMQTQIYGIWRDSGSGKNHLADTTDFTIRRGRLGFYGVLDEVWGMALRLEYSGDQRIGPLEVAEEPEDNLYLYELFVFSDLSDQLRFRAGKLRIHLTREGMESCFAPLSTDRSLFIYTPFQRLRDVGLVGWGNIADGKFQYRLAVSEGRESEDSPKSNFRYTARAHVSLWDPEDQYSYKATYLGDRKVFTIGAGYQYESEVVYGNLPALTLEKDYRAWTFDAYLEYPFSLGVIGVLGSYMVTDFDDAYKGGDPDEACMGLEGQKNGTVFRAGYLLPRSVGPGKVQFFSRYENWEFARLFNTYDQEISWFSVGVNYLIKGQDIRVTFEYAGTDYQKEDPAEEVADFSTVNVMLQLRF